MLQKYTHYISEEAISYLKTTYALILTITFKLLNKMDQKLTNTSKIHYDLKSQNVLKKPIGTTKIAKTTLPYRQNR